MFDVYSKNVQWAKYQPEYAQYSHPATSSHSHAHHVQTPSYHRTFHSSTITQSHAPSPSSLSLSASSSPSSSTSASPSNSCLPSSKTTIMSLPSEIRIQIFSKLMTFPDPPVHLLRVCSAFYSETRFQLFKRRIDFDSQQDLYAWIKDLDYAQGIDDEGNGGQYLKYVSGIGIRLQDIGGEELMQSFGERMKACSKVGRSSKDCAPASPYSRELSRLKSALLRFVNVKEFRIDAPLSNEIPPNDEFYDCVLACLHRSLPNLERLSIRMDRLGSNLSFLPKNKHLRKLSLSGYSMMTPEEAITVFQRAPKLDGLELFGPPQHMESSRDGRTNWRDKRLVQTITPSVIKSMSKLRSFAIHEERDACRKHSVFVSHRFLTALGDRHGRSLRTLDIWTDVDMSHEARTTLRHLLSHSSIKTLTLCMRSSTEDCLRDVAALPKSLRTLQMSFPHHEKDTRKVIEAICARKRSLRDLVDLKLRLNWTECSRHADQVFACVLPFAKMLKSLGCRVSWSWWVPSKVKWVEI